METVPPRGGGFDRNGGGNDGASEASDESETEVLNLTDPEVAEVQRLEDLASQKIDGAKALIRHCVRTVDAAARGYFCCENDATNFVERAQLNKFRRTRLKRYYDFEARHPDGAAVPPAGAGAGFMIEVMRDVSGKSKKEVPHSLVETYEQLQHIDESNAKEERAALTQLQTALDSKALAGAILRLDDDNPYSDGYGDFERDRTEFLYCYTGFFEVRKGLYVCLESLAEARALYSDEV